jgi:2-dehydro-3-deoxygluconokinase
MKKVVTFGEIMGRISCPGFTRFRQAAPGALDIMFAGSEANVAVSLALFGMNATYVTALPKHALADSCIAVLRGFDVDTSHIVRTDQGRLGLYFVEAGANQRPSNVIYDRDYSAIGVTPADQYDWKAIFDGAGWFHVSGITPAVSRQAADATLTAVTAAKEAGVNVSCDLNFRKKLWAWDNALPPRKLAEQTMRKVLPFVDVVIANEGDCADVLGIHAQGTDVEAGKLDTGRYPDVARQVVAQFPNITQVAITLRESISASHNNWGAMLYCAKKDNVFFAPTQDATYQPYQIKNIVDRIGGGDSFAAGLIYGLNDPELTGPEEALQFAVAASCLAHSISGDFNISSRAEVMALMKGSGSGRVVR